MKDLRRKRFYILAIGVIIAILIVTLVNDDKPKDQIVIVNSEIDMTKTLGEQVSAFKTIPISKEEAAQFENSVVRDISELKDKIVLQPLERGNPIPKSILVDINESGEYTSRVLKNRTYYKFGAMLPDLPPGIIEGDEVDVFLQYNAKEGDEVVYYVETLLEKVKIALIREQDVYLDVSQKEFNILQAASNIGQFVLQVPGKKDAPSCLETSAEETDTECISEEDEAADIDTRYIKQILGKDKVEFDFIIDFEDEDEENEENNWFEEGQNEEEGNPFDEEQTIYDLE